MNRARSSRRKMGRMGTSVKDMGRSLCTIIKVGFTPETVMNMIK